MDVAIVVVDEVDVCGNVEEVTKVPAIVVVVQLLVVDCGESVVFVAVADDSSVMIFCALNLLSRASLTVSFFRTKVPVRIIANILARAKVYRLIAAARFLLRASPRSASRNTSSANSS